MNPVRRLQDAFQAVQHLGGLAAARYALYQLGVKSGLYRLLTPLTQPHSGTGLITRPLALFADPPPNFPALLNPAEQKALLAQAEDLLAGRFALYGGDPAPLNLTPPPPLRHWSQAYPLPASQDIKDLWEPARFGWAFTLVRAYQLSADERFPAAFWQAFETFQTHNPPNLGPQWASAQEVALRLMAWVYAASALAASPHSTAARLQSLSGAVWDHARRIPPTLLYARAQRNNHLLSEAAGLYTAGQYLQHAPWRARGWAEFQKALLDQIAPDGTYGQHSVNYHRLMLQLALWMHALGTANGEAFSPECKERLAAAVRWLLAHVDPSSGQLPNLGHHDGALFLPLASSSIRDYRPTLQAAALTFLGAPAFPPGPWDELALRLGLSASSPALPPKAFTSPAVHRLGTSQDWALLRAVHFSVRPAHADQMHVDLWHQGQNIALDAGTFRYNTPPPWQNALASAAVHNTLTLNGLEPMRRAGRFLWLDWDQAKILSNPSPDAISAEHSAYRALGLRHQRTLQRTSTGWRIRDELLPLPAATINPVQAVVHWLLPDLPWVLNENELTLSLTHGPLVIRCWAEKPQSPPPLQVRLIRAGEILSGPAGSFPNHGWFSPTYAHKLPTLSLRVELSAPPPLTISTEFILPPAPTQPAADFFPG